MHSLVRRFLKTAIAFLGLGLTIGGWMMIRRELSGVYPSPYLVSAHTHAILVGFVMSMILGVALWLFPRPERENPRYQPRVAGELLRQINDATWLRWVVVLSGLAQIAGLGAFSMAERVPNGRPGSPVFHGGQQYMSGAWCPLYGRPVGWALGAVAGILFGVASPAEAHLTAAVLGKRRRRPAHRESGAFVLSFIKSRIQKATTPSTT